MLSSQQAALQQAYGCRQPLAYSRGACTCATCAGALHRCMTLCWVCISSSHDSKLPRPHAMWQDPELKTSCYCINIACQDITITRTRKAVMSIVAAHGHACIRARLSCAASAAKTYGSRARLDCWHYIPQQYKPCTTQRHNSHGIVASSIRCIMCLASLCMLHLCVEHLTNAASN